MGAVSVESTELFVGSAESPLQVVRVAFAGAGQALVHIEGTGVTTPVPVGVAAQGETTVEIGVDTLGAAAGSVLPAVAVVEVGGDRAEASFELVVAEPGWTMHMVSHFHYDPVWWNTQAAYTIAWDTLDFPGSPRGARQLAGFDLVRAHLELALAEPEYRFVLAEVDYLKPYWDAYPGDRDVLRRLMDEGRIEVLGGAYNEPNTNLTDPETTVRNFVHGMGFQRDVFGGAPATAWQLDAFGHDPAFPGFAADAGLTSSSWARGPFHQWGPMERTETGRGDPTRMQFPSEFEWVSPSGRGVLTSYMADHYGSGWAMDSAISLADAGEAAYRIFLELKKVAGTWDVLLPVGGDYTPPNKWVTQVHRDFAARYVWPRFVCSLPRDFFAAVRSTLDARGVSASPQTRDMNPIYTGKDVSYIDTKQAQRAAEVAVLEAEAFAVFARLLAGSSYPDGALAKAWVQLAYGAHHDAITGSESDQVYLDLVTSWRDAHDLAVDVRERALSVLSGLVAPVTGDGVPVVVWNSLSHPRTDVVTVRTSTRDVVVVDADGAELPTLVEPGSVTFLASDVPAMGWRSYLLRPSSGGSTGWDSVEGVTVSSDRFQVTVDPARGGGVSSLLDRGRELIEAGRVGNELAVYEEYPQHPRFGEGPWHLLPRGPVTTSASSTASVDVTRCALGERVTVRGVVGSVRYTQTITLWNGVSRVDCVTTVDEFTGSDQLLRLRWPCPVPGALPVSEVGNAVVGRGFGLIDVDSAVHPWTLDNPAHTWFGLSSAAALRLADGALRPIGVAEIIVPTLDEAAPLARELAVALARCGVTSTVSAADGARYGDLGVDSNLPDVRITLGGAEVNAFTAEVLERAEAGGDGVFWVPPVKPLADVWQPSADLRDARALGVLVVSGADLPAVVRSVVDDLADNVVEVGSGDPGGPSYVERTVAVLNRGLPGFAVDSAGTLHASLLRSCTGWPSGVWVDPPRRTVPDGSNFQLQHWTHVFEYAVAAGEGDWREAGIAETSAEFSRPLHAVVAEPGGDAAASSAAGRKSEAAGSSAAGAAASGTAEDSTGGRESKATGFPVAGDGAGGAVGEPGSGAVRLPGVGSLVRVEPVGRVRLAAVKAAGNPLARGSAVVADPRDGVAFRVVAHTGAAAEARIESEVVGFREAVRANLLEEPGDGLAGLAVPVAGCDAVTLVAMPVGGATGDLPVIGVEAEAAQPLYAKYWLHNRGPAPLGGLPLAVHFQPTLAEVAPGADVELELTVASDSIDADLPGVVRFAVPEGWRVSPDEVPFGLPAGGYLATSVTVSAPGDAAVGRYPVRASVAPVGAELPASWGQVVEDVAVLTVGTPAEDGLIRLVGEPVGVRLRAGESGRLAVRVASAAGAAIAVEAAVVSPWGTWDLVGPRAVGAELPAHGEVELGFEVAVPAWAGVGTWWALVRVAGAGRLLYSPAVPLEVVE